MRAIHSLPGIHGQNLYSLCEDRKIVVSLRYICGESTLTSGSMLLALGIHQLLQLALLVFESFYLGPADTLLVNSSDLVFS